MKAYYDLHIHSCLSPCAENDMTPYNLVNMAALLGYDVIALTDHNTSAACRTAVRVGEQAGVVVVPGMELCTAEEVHNVCLFPDVDAAEAFSAFIRTTLPPVRNRPEIFGDQLLTDEEDNIVGREDILLLTASSVTETELPALIEQYGGAVFPAHIDRDSHSVISNLGWIDASMGFLTAEIYDASKTDDLKERYPDLRDMRILHSSDAHSLERMRDRAHTLELPSCTAEAVVRALRTPLQ